MKIRTLGAELFHADRQTDRRRLRHVARMSDLLRVTSIQKLSETLGVLNVCKVCVLHNCNILLLTQQPKLGQGRLILEFPYHTQWHNTFGRTPLDGWSARRRDLYLTTHNTQKRQTSVLAAGFEPAIPASERPQVLVLDRVATGMCKCNI
jgi:hypothetical protein